MNSYYESLFNELDQKIERNQIQEAYDLIHQEIALPYVPQDALERLEEYQRTCLGSMEIPTSKTFEPDQWLEWIDGSLQEQLQALSHLKISNLRCYEPEVQKLLDSSLPDVYKGELIELLMEQKIDSPFHVRKDGLTITFVPGSLLEIDEDPTIQKVFSLLEEWIASKDPICFDFCKSLFYQEILTIRPFDLSQEDPLEIAKAIIRLVYRANYDDESYQEFVEEKGLKEIFDITLSIEKEGELK